MIKHAYYKQFIHILGIVRALCLIDLMGRVFDDPGDRGSIPGRVIPKT